MIKALCSIFLIIILVSCGDGVDEVTHAGYCEGYPDWEESKYNLPW